MASADDTVSLQYRTLSCYLAMTKLHPNWERRLVMLSASSGAAPIALATLAAGGAALWVCAQRDSLRDDAQSGIVDFQVDALGEALRILKNEIRKGRPVSVGVLDERETVWQQAVERGLQPQALLAEAQHQTWTETLIERGAEPLALPSPVEALTHTARNWRERRESDERLLAAAAVLPLPERERALRWLRQAPRLFPRDLCRFYPTAWSASNQSDERSTFG